LSHLQPNTKQSYFNEGLAEVLGGESKKELRQANSAAAQIDLCIATFGKECTRGILQRAGRAGLYYWLQDHAADLGWQQPEFRLLSFRQKIKRGITDLASWFEHSASGKFAIDTQTDKLVIQHTSEQSLSQMDCAFYLGLFQEFLSWSASGKFFPATEVQCPNGGQGAHVFEIALNPLD
jgi:hypothetical protein